ncbi:MAG: hypothetical protein V1678_03020 [Candidatus Aenigmatarchaeota archaeon]
MKKFTEYEKGFLEGLIDGEGSIEFSRHRVYGNGDNTVSKSGFNWRIRMSIFNNSLKLLEKVKAISELGFIIRKTDKNYELRYGPKALREMLPQIKLVIKERELSC